MSAPEAAGEREPRQAGLLLASPLLSELGVRHGFFMRAGGVSKVPFDSLNFSASVGDDPLSVQRNRELGARALGVSADRVFRVSQVHGSDVVVVQSEEGAAETAKKPGDAVISATPGTACGVITADCVPILLASRTSGHVAAVHSGWKGFVAGVLPRTIGVLRELGAGELVAAIGPHISLDAFEVSEDVAEQLAGLAPGVDIVRPGNPRPHVDLRRLARAQLLSCGLAADAVDDVMGCTYLEPSRFFSFRRDGARSGRQLAAIVARETT